MILTIITIFQKYLSEPVNLYLLIYLSNSPNT